MDKLLPTVIVIIVLVLALGGMYLGWRRRARSHGAIAVPDAVPADTGARLFQASALYVATTLGGQPLERVAAHGLGFRARASVSVFETGIAVELTGRDAFFIDSANLRGAGRSSWAIDKGVETGGLVRLEWRLGETALDSYLRLAEGDRELLDAAGTIARDASSTEAGQ